MDSQTSLPVTSNATIVAARHTSPALCYKSTLVTSAGLWLGNSPFEFSLPLLMTHICLFVVTSHVTHFFLRRIGQPMMVSQIVGGMLYGPTFIGRSRRFTRTLFPGGSKMHLDTVAGVSLLLFLFVVGVKTDLAMLKKSGKKAAAIGIFSSVVPFLILVSIGLAIQRSFPIVTHNLFLLQFASTWSRTSYVVLSCLLDELHLLNSKLGRIAMSGTLIEEFANTVVSSISTAITLGIHASTPVLGLGSFVSFVFFVSFIVFVARPLVLFMIRRTPEGELLDENNFLAIIIIAYVCGFVGEVIGHHFTTGAFILGLALPGGPPLGTTLDEKLGGVIVWMGVPVFMAMSGYRTNLASIPDKGELAFFVIFVVTCALGKMFGVLLPCLYCKMPLRDAVTLGLMFNFKGIFELYVLNNWIDSQAVNLEGYSVVVISVVMFAAVTCPLVKYLYKPSMRYVAYKRRTIQHSKPDSELRLLVCVRSEENVDPIIRLLEAAQFIRDSPVCLYLLHVLQLVGQTASMLVPYKRHKGTDSDHIVNAFKYLERRNKDTMLVQPFVSICPQATMHDDVCSVAMDKKVAFVILPFHKQMGIDGTMEATSHAYRNMNICVFDYAPCSVGVLIDHGLAAAAGGTVFTAAHIEHIGMYFIGGPDDRESLALAVRMVGNSTMGLTVIRFVPPKEWRSYSLEEKMDDEMVNDFRLQSVQRKNVLYSEQVVKDGEETVAVMRSMKDFGLLIVGRRYGLESPITAGLSMWSEYPELGIIGDVLASTDYGSKVATLVVQQQSKVGADQGGVNCHFGLGTNCYMPARTTTDRAEGI